MKILVVGGGPAGLSFSSVAKKFAPDWEITVLERGAADNMDGWGIVFPPDVFGWLPGYRVDRTVSLDRIVLTSDRGTSSVKTSPLCSLDREILRHALRKQCSALGITLKYRQAFSSADLAAVQKRYDVVVGADGVNSVIRKARASRFGQQVYFGKNRYVWLGADTAFDNLNIVFKNTEHGAFAAHCYAYDKKKSTFIVECPPSTWLAAGFDKASAEECCSRLESIFKEELHGKRISRRGKLSWREFMVVKNERFTAGNLALIGDAAYTAHFSLGSGTRAALLDAMTLASALVEQGDVKKALAAYNREIGGWSAELQRAAESSMRWFERVEEHCSRKGGDLKRSFGERLGLHPT